MVKLISLVFYLRTRAKVRGLFSNTSNKAYVLWLRDARARARIAVGVHLEDFLAGTPDGGKRDDGDLMSSLEHSHPFFIFKFPNDVSSKGRGSQVRAMCEGLEGWKELVLRRKVSVWQTAAALHQEIEAMTKESFVQCSFPKSYI